MGGSDPASGTSDGRHPRHRRRGEILVVVAVVLLIVTLGALAIVSSVSNKPASTSFSPVSPAEVPPTEATYSSSPSESPQSSAPESQPSGSTTVVVPSSAPDAEGISSTLAAYFNGINEGDYDAAFAQLGPGAGGTGSSARFADQMRSTTNSDIEVVDAQPLGADQAVVDVNFISHQDPEKGPEPGQTCDLWMLRYIMIRESDGHWLINKSEGRDGQPTYQPC